MKKTLAMVVPVGRFVVRRGAEVSTIGGEESSAPGVVEIPPDVTHRTWPLTTSAQYQSRDPEYVVGETSRVSTYGPGVFTTGGDGCSPFTRCTMIGIAEITLSPAERVLLPSLDSVTAAWSSAIAHRK